MWNDVNVKNVNISKCDDTSLDMSSDTISVADGSTAKGKSVWAKYVF